MNEVIDEGRLDLTDELYGADLADGAKRWIAPFRASFPDVHTDIVELIAEGHTVVGRFRCSGTHQGPWLGHPPTGRRFHRIDEVYLFRTRDGKITHAWGPCLRRTRRL